MVDGNPAEAAAGVRFLKVFAPEGLADEALSSEALRVSSVPCPLDAFLPAGEHLIYRSIARALGLREKDVIRFRLLKRSVDARRKSDVHFNGTFAVDLAEGVKPRPARGVSVSPYRAAPALHISRLEGSLRAAAEPRPMVVGTGPAGLFCALVLAEAGLAPLVVERGADVDGRMAAIESFASGGPLDVRTNVQFGEGGAGTFSDGKLNTGTKSPHIRHVLAAFVQAGAPDDILWQAKPHIGTDCLVGTVHALRRRIQDAGGEVRFLTKLEDLRLEAGRVAGAVLKREDTGAEEEIEVSRLVLACGHSARDTFALVKKAGFAMERKPFSVGARIEHPQGLIDRVQYGSAAGHPCLGAADYKLAVHTASGRGVYTFCMCPGGQVVAAASEEGGLCVNGMSRRARDGANANSALLVGVDPADLPGSDVLEGVRFQRALEQAAYGLAMEGGAAPYTAPAQTVGDFMAGAWGSASRMVEPSYPRGVAWSDLSRCLPPFVVEAMREAFPMLDAKLKGFAHGQAVLTGVETRSSSPVRILRGDDFQAPSPGGAGSSGLYPCGEGAGYAGGIMSAAVDGIRVAEAIMEVFG